jgi:hypothetical protein
LSQRPVPNCGRIAANVSRLQTTFASLSAGSVQTDGMRRFQPWVRWGTAVSLAPTRVTAPWKCSNRIAVIGEGTVA